MNFNKSRAVLLCGCVILIASCLISLGIGALSLPIEQVVYALLTPVCTNLDISAQTQSVVLNAVSYTHLLPDHIERWHYP